MPPEQVRGDVAAVGPGSDVYSLGAVLYELLTGRRPFDGEAVEVMAKHLRDEPPPPSTHRPEVDPLIEAICLKTLAKEPSRRFLSMGEFAQALDDYLHGVRSPCVVAPTEADPLEVAADEALVLLRAWGWRSGRWRLRDKFRPACSEGCNPRLALLLRWLEGDETAHAEAVAAFATLRQLPALAGWALVGRVFIRNRRHDFGGAAALLCEAAEGGDPRDHILQASIAHQRGFCDYSEGRLTEALAALRQALDLCGRDHFLTGHILDTLGRVYARKNNFHAAREFYEQARLCKQRFGDDWAVADSLRGLGALYLDWDELDRAEETFQTALELSQQSQDERGRARSFNYLGRIAIEQGEREARAGRRVAARRYWTRAAEWLDASIRTNQALQKPWRRPTLIAIGRCSTRSRGSWRKPRSTAGSRRPCSRRPATRKG
jgi:hypothetical protein